MRISLAWLREFVDLPETVEELRAILDDLGLVVEGVELVGEGLDDVVIARVDEIRAIKGADRIRLVIADAGQGSLEIVCGATNFAVGDYVPLAPVGAVLPGGFEISQRKMRGVTSNGMLCSARELGLSDDHEGLMVLNELTAAPVGTALRDALAIEPDVVFDISVEGNRPDAWSVEGVARDLAARLRRHLRAPKLAEPNAEVPSAASAAAGIDDPELCGRLTVSVLRNVRVGPSPTWVVRRLESAGMRAISNVVDASNLVMLELGQPTHPYDATHVAGRTLRARAARAGEVLETLDGTVRELAKAGRGLGDTGQDCVIVDGDDRVLGLAGIMGGAASEISDSTSEVLLEAAYFDPMTIARSSKRHGLRTEASNRFERGVDPQLALRAVGRFVAVLAESTPDLEWLVEPLDVWGEVPTPPIVHLRAGDLERVLGVEIESSEVSELLGGLGFIVHAYDGDLEVHVPSARLDVRPGAAGRADVIEEIARLYGYQRLGRRTPTWPEPGRLSARQVLRRSVRDFIVDLGVHEAWTPTLGSDGDFDLLHPGMARVRVTNPLASDESVLRASMLVGLVRAWGRNLERGTGEVMLGEFGTVFMHPDVAVSPRATRGGAGGTTMLSLPNENERLTVILGRDGDDARTAVALWQLLAHRIGLDDVVVRSVEVAPSGLHPTRSAALVDRSSGAVLGYVGEIDSQLVGALVPSVPERRVGVVDIDLDVLADPLRTSRRPVQAVIPSRYPSASIDLAFVVPDDVHAGDLAHELAGASPLVESIELFDVYRAAGLAASTRSLAYGVRLGAHDHTLSDEEIAVARRALIERAGSLGASLR
ncbi:MAG TPA: phenylalanine--tRNA ligase subunit beta [Acidimicrobiales bacterium]|nr:phenylalanine--tRNA ligase subunit beta [Acidimicrobiales bacterium]